MKQIGGQSLSNLIKKVFSQKLAKSYYISRIENPPVNGLPCFSLEEVEYIKTNDVSTEELEYIYKMKIEDPLFSFLPKKEALPLGTVIERVDSRDEGTKAAMRECVDFVLKRGLN